MKQVKFRELSNEDVEIGGILLDNGNIICGCCGGLFEKDNPDIEILEEFDDWVDISHEIIGN